MKHSLKILGCLGILLLSAQPMFAAERLNNMVTELARVEFSPEEGAAAHSVSFETEREGWIYVGFSGKIPLGGKISVALDDGPETALEINAETTLPEKMCYVKAGAHVLKIQADSETSLASVVVRAIPEIVFFSIDNHILSRRKVDYSIIRTYRSLWDQGILQNFNVIASDPATHTELYEKEIDEWHALGRRWIAKTSVPKDGETMAGVETLWAKPLANALSDGAIIDEITPRLKAMIPYWAKAIRELAKRPESDGKKLYAFTSLGYPELYLPLVESIMASDYYYAPEVYLRSPGDLTGITSKMKTWRETKPGIEKHMMIFLGPDNMAPAVTFHVHPDQNYKVFLQKQFQMLVSEPAFSGLAGVGFWSAHYMDDDILRCFARLARHYLIEGQTGPLITDPLILPHLENPGFEEGTKGWKLEPASSDSLLVKDTSIIPFKKGPYSALPEKEKVLYTKRSKEKPNVIAQTIRHLEPGRLYHLNVYALDLKNFQKAEPIAVDIQLSGAEILPEHTKDSVIRTKALPKDTKDETGGDAFVYEIVKGKVDVTWNSYHRLFRATSETAELVISDWPGAPTPNGPEGQEIIWDFIELAPDMSLDPVLPKQDQAEAKEPETATP